MAHYDAAYACCDEETEVAFRKDASEINRVGEGLADRIGVLDSRKLFAVNLLDIVAERLLRPADTECRHDGFFEHLLVRNQVDCQNGTVLLNFGCLITQI